MTLNRHLLPDEFDQLLDNEVGFGVPPLLAHVRECPQCAAELEAARTVMTEIEHLPHLAPSVHFADKVMAKVNVYRPWHVAAVEAARTLVPKAGPVRALVAVSAAFAAMTLTGVALWAATRADSVLVLLGLVAENTRRAAGGVVGTLFGDAAVTALQAGGGRAALMAAGAMVAASVAGVLIVARATRAIRARSR